MYSLIELERDIESIITELADVRAQKGHDYSGTADTLDNLRAFGWKGVVVRLGDKFHRLKHYVLSGEDLLVKDESIEDTLQDYINYALFALILYRQEKEKAKTPQPCPEKGFALGRHEIVLPSPINKDIQTKIERAAARAEDLEKQRPKGKVVDWERDIPGGEV